MERETLEKLYAGLIGMDAGMRLGAPVENPFWTYERLQSYYGDIRGYLREQRYYTADDDVNGPLIFVRALADNAMPETLAPETVGERRRAPAASRKTGRPPPSRSADRSLWTPGGSSAPATRRAPRISPPQPRAYRTAAAAWTARGLWPRASPRRIRRPRWTRCWMPVCASCRRSATTAAW